MTNMFKKSLVAAAIAGMSVSATAGEISFDGVKSDNDGFNTTSINAGTEWLSSQNAAVKFDGDIVIELDANYTLNDRVTLTFSGDSLDEASLPQELQWDDGGSPVTDEVALGLISTEVNGDGDTVVVYRVTEVSGTTVNAELTLNDTGNELDFDPEKVVAGEGVTVSFAASTNDGLSLDTSGGPARSIQLVDTAVQYNLAFNQWDNSVIDVSDDRESFEGGVELTSGSSMILPETGATFDTGYSYAASDVDVEYTMSGNFGFAFDEDDNVDASILTSAVDEATSSELVYSVAGGTTSDVDFDFSGADIAIPAQTFGLSAVVVTPDGSKTVQGVGGSWTLNGSTVNVSYVPYGDNITHVINVTNRSAQSGDISVIAYPENGGDAIDLGAIAESEAGSITRIAGEIIDALTEETGVDHNAPGSTTRYAFDIVTNAPANAVEVYTAYNVAQTGARLVVNTSNGASESADSNANAKVEALCAALEASDATTDLDCSNL